MKKLFFTRKKVFSLPRTPSLFQKKRGILLREKSEPVKSVGFIRRFGKSRVFVEGEIGTGEECIY